MFFAPHTTWRGCAEQTRREWKRHLEIAVADGLGWRTLRGMNRADPERWFSMRAIAPKDSENLQSVTGARTHNAYVVTLHAFGLGVCVKDM
ncbi:MAG TPA: hypothetical protein PLO62_09760 [Candidatus Hydrogenedentes bacterium]|nr:hypothetical protein [Candidatus Hydrogenedentota bacterium]